MPGLKSQYEVLKAHTGRVDGMAARPCRPLLATGGAHAPTSAASTLAGDAKPTGGERIVGTAAGRPYGSDGAQSDRRATCPKQAVPA